MDNKRRKRIEESIQRELGRILLHYPRHQIFNKVTITLVEMSADLAVAKVFFSLFDGVDIQEATEVLNQEASFFRKLLAQKLNLRMTPKVNFVYDESLQRSRRVMDLIDEKKD
jgi:ribosome-binding factor A